MAKPGQRVDETVSIRGPDHLPDADQLAQQIALAAPNTGDAVDPAQDAGVFPSAALIRAALLAALCDMGGQDLDDASR